MALQFRHQPMEAGSSENQKINFTKPFVPMVCKVQRVIGCKRLVSVAIKDISQPIKDSFLSHTTRPMG